MGYKAINMISKLLELHILSPYPGMATFLFWLSCNFYFILLNKCKITPLCSYEDNKNISVQR